MSYLQDNWLLWNCLWGLLSWKPTEISAGSCLSQLCLIFLIHALEEEAPTFWQGCQTLFPGGSSLELISLLARTRPPYHLLWATRLVSWKAPPLPEPWIGDKRGLPAPNVNASGFPGAEQVASPVVSVSAGHGQPWSAHLFSWVSASHIYDAKYTTEHKAF